MVVLFGDESGDGISSSLYRPGPAQRRVPALRLSDWLRHESLADGGRVLLLRMNIEGAEPEVIADLIDAGLHGYVDGWYGLWDDMGKIDPQRDAAFRRLLRAHGIRPVTFNGRDLRWPWRVRCIAYDMRTSLRAGARRLARAGNVRAGDGARGGLGESQWQ
jgi:hypothetical protein